MEDAVSVDTSTGQLLFDGHRAHFVTPFTGERYSIVFYSIQQFEKASVAAADFLASFGVQFPTESSHAYFSRLLAPPRGYTEHGGSQRSIREAFGFEEKKQVLFYPEPKRSLATLTIDALHVVLSMLLTPVSMSALCAISRRMSTLARSVPSWEGTTIDTYGIRPTGRLAHHHFLYWRSARSVINGRWSGESVSLMTSKAFFTWQWLERGGSPFLRTDRRFWVMVGQRPAGFKAEVFFELPGGQNPEKGTVNYGLSSTPVPLQALRKHLGNGRKQDQCVTAQIEVEALSATLVSLTYPPNNASKVVELRVDGELREKRDGSDLDPERLYFAVVIFDFLPIGHVKPCWSYRDCRD